MNRPWKTWIIFALCLAVLLVAMGWVSFAALRLDHAQIEARRQTDYEERVRLALWRMDSMLAPIVAQESARPYFVYRAFYPMGHAYNRMFNAIQPGEVLVPSPLLTQVSSNVLLHFQSGPDGVMTSPQVPAGNERDLAESGYTSSDQNEVAAARLRMFQSLVERFAPQTRSNSPAATTSLDAGEGRVQSAKSAKSKARTSSQILMALTPPPDPSSPPMPVANFTGQQAQQRMSQRPSQQQQKAVPNVAEQQAELNQFELTARAQSLQQAVNVNYVNNAVTVTQGAQGGPAQIIEGAASPVWLGDALVLTRRVSVQGVEYLQGCWLDWPGLRRWLLDAVKDLLPGASLQPMSGNGADPQARMLVSLPLRLLPGEVQTGSSASVTPIVFALIVAWICMLLAVAAVVVLLRGALSLSERRGAFVSAVTHELRTPLTTFRMYSEMLAEGMVTEERQRRQYLDTLCSEARRLSHLVENVLAYARLEQGRASHRVERLTLGELVCRIKPGLVQRASQAGMSIQDDSVEDALATVVHVDVGAVEQILFNLVDNACKYAAPSGGEGVIHLEVLPERGRFAMVRIRDHGQGISAEGRRRLFKPFSKSAHEAAHTAPGVGLGLALCRRLSRSMGGDLHLEPAPTPGACFVLSLPVDASGPAAIA